MTATAASLLGPATDLAGFPVELTSFVGRDDELAHLVSATGATRLLSLVGPGGSGKSRLAMRLAAVTAARFPDGIHWVDLAARPDPSISVPGELAGKLRLHDAPGTDTGDAVCDHLANRRALLVFDGCEHVIDSCAALITQILVECRDVVVVATSRESLKIVGETEFPVPPLSQPPEPADDVTVDDVARSGAARLFVERVRAVHPGFELTDGTRLPVARICHLVDGMPLALELAAARVRVLSVDDLALRLENSISVLTSSARSGPARHRTLRATLDWSYQLLSEAERALLAALSVFAGGFTLDAVASVCSPAGDDPVIDQVSQLLDKSLVFVVSRGGSTRYRMLQTVRRYAGERLAELHEVDAVTGRHAAFYAELAVRTDELDELEQRAGYDRLADERDNMQAALQWFADAGDAQNALRMTTALAGFWSVRGHYRDGGQCLETALAIDAPAPARLRTAALITAGRLAQLRCDYPEADRLLREGLARGEASDDAEDRRLAAAALQALGSVARERGAYDEAVSLHRESLRRWLLLDDARNVERSGYYLAFAAWLSGDHAEATTLAMDALVRARALPDLESVVSCLIVLGGAADSRGDVAEAEVLLGEALEMARDTGFAEGEGWALNLLGVVASHRGDLVHAGELLRSALTIQRDLGDLWRVASILDQLVGVAAAAGDGQRAGHLAGAAAALRDRLGTAVPSVEAADRDAALAAAEAVLSDQQLAAAVDTGRALSFETALDYASRYPRRIPGSEPETPVGAVAQESEAPRLAVEALGAARVRLSGELLPAGDFSYAKPRELLYFLLDRTDCTKDEIGAALWPWSSPAQLRNSFHTTLHHLRQALRSPTWVRFRHGRYGMDRRAAYVYDVDEFVRLVAEARAEPSGEDVVAALERAISCYAGDFLTDLPGESWIADRRAELRRTFESALFDLGAAHTAAARPDAAVDVFRRLVALDPLIESAHRELIRSYAQLGDHGRALQQYRDLARLLNAELGAAPSPETVELAATLRRAGAR